MQLPLDLSALTTLLTVSQLNQRVRDALDAGLDECWIVGEISNFRVPPSGHFYFSLKDTRSQIAAVMFRSANQLLAFRPEDGMEVIVRGRVGVYEVRGALQLYVEAMEPRGVGALQLALEQLKKRLAAEGLFAEARKRPLPFLPRAVGIVTALNWEGGWRVWGNRTSDYPSSTDPKDTFIPNRRMMEMGRKRR